MTVRGRSLVITVAAGMLSLVLAACGSQLSPEEVRAASAGTGAGGLLQQGTVPGDTAAGGADTAPGTTDASAGPAPAAGGSGSSAASGSGSGGGQGSGANSASGTVKSGPCAGFKNQTGITDKKIVIANVADVSGPVPGLFQSSQDAVKAYIAYFNASSDICGRKLELMALDSRTNAGADQEAYAKACENTFAAVGSMSGFDEGGAKVAEGCGIPDIRAAAVMPERHDCRTCFGAQSTNSIEFENAVPDYVKKYHPAAFAKAGFLWLNAGAGAANAKYQIAAEKRRGMHFVYTQGVDVSEFNYAPYVQQLKDRGVKYVQWIGPYQNALKLAQAMKQQSYKPEVFMLDPTAYDPGYVEQGGDAVEGTTVFLNFTPFEETSSNKELQLYQSWLQQVKPGAAPTFFGLFSWSAARLFVERSIGLGGKLSRASLVQSVRGVDNWTANGMHSPQHVGAKRTGDCWRFVKLTKGKWVPEAGTKYRCSGTTTVG